MLQRIFTHDLPYVILNQGILSLASVLIVVLLARFTDQVTFGEIRYLIAVLAIFAFCSLPGISLVINHEASKMMLSDFKKLVTLQFKWGLGAFLASMMMAFFYMLNDKDELAQAFIIGGLLAPVANLYQVPGQILAGMRRFKLKTIVDASIMLAILIGAFLGAYLFSDVSLIIAFYLGTQAAVTLAALLCTSKMLPLHSELPARRSDFRDGAQLTFFQIPFSLIPAIEKALIFIILGPVALAMFVIAVLPVEHFKSAFRNLMQFYVLPHLEKQNVNQLLRWFATAALLLTLGVAALVLFILYGMPLLFENFTEARNLSLLLVIAVFPLPIHVIMINWIANRKMRRFKWYAALSISTNVLLISYSAFFFGLTGAVVAKVVYEIMLATSIIYLDTRSKLLGEPH